MSGSMDCNECPVLILADENPQLLVHEEPSSVQDRGCDEVVDGAFEVDAFCG
jgi:hypothetical protein